jgi:nucleotide-binding universal stress UspA family protein
MFEHVVVGVSESAGAAQAVVQAMDMAQASGGTLHLVSAFGSHRPEAPAMPEEFRYSIGSVDPVDWRLSQLEAAAKHQSISVMTHAVLADPVEALTKVARDEQADVIVIGSGLSDGALHRGKVADGLLRRASCAVLVVEPDPPGDSPSK